MTVTDANTVEQMHLDTVAKLGGMPASMMREDAPDNLTVLTRPSYHLNPILLTAEGNRAP